MEDKIDSTNLGQPETGLALRYGTILFLFCLLISVILFLILQNYSVIFFTLTIGGFLSWLTGKFIARPITTLLSSLQELKDDNDYSMIEIETKIPEIKKICQEINSLIENKKIISEKMDKQATLSKIEFEDLKIKHNRQVQQYKAIGFVAKAIVSLQETETILQRITQLISDHFGYYHVGIFLIDDSKENANLKATNSEGGLKMLARGHSLKVGKVGIVGYVTDTGEARIASDTGSDAVFFDNPDLPETRSEMALPLKLGDGIIGALDIQSTEPSAFSDEDVNILSTLADQIALVMQNSELFEETRKSLKDLEVINRQYIKSSWEKLPQETNLYGYALNSKGGAPIKEKINSIQKNQSNLNKELSIPIQLRGVTIGSLKIENNKDRSFTNDQVDIALAVADRVAISLENARLLDEASRVAQRERAVGEITTKIRSVNEPQLMIQTALDELKRILQIEQIRISPLKNVSSIGETIDGESEEKSDPGYRTQ